jgi:pSer/pThr/pTyr-binding forkhead associated (FHA) protein
MEELIIKHHKRLGRLSEFVKSSGKSLTLGRGYKNDVILSDHFIAAEQLRFDYEDGKWKLKVLDKTNPVMINNSPVTGDDAVINSGDELMVGRTQLVLLTSDHPVERTRKLIRSSWSSHRWLRIILPILAVLFSVLMGVLSEYLYSSGEIQWGIIFAAGLLYALLMVLWAGGWALAGRVLHHKPNFFLQLLYSALILAGMTVGAFFTGYTEFAFSNRTFGHVVEIGFLVFIFSLLLKVNLKYATVLKRRTLISTLIVALLTTVIISISLLGTSEFSTRPDYSKSVKAPFAKWSSDISMDKYFNSVETQFKRVQEELD